MKNKMVLLKVIGIREIRPNAYITLLSNIENTRKLPIVIGATEARAIAFSIERIKTERPITHDLIITLLQSFDIELEKVSIVKLHKGIFYAEISLKRGDAVVKIDARPSDAIAIALRFKRPIFCNKDIMEEASIETGTENQTEAEDAESEESDPGNLNIEDLTAMMQDAAESEDYELAAKFKLKIKELKEKEVKEQNDKDENKE
ncbi:MAG: bifunctional nuclease family protein [Bacteroidota bacterium]|nr:bifunctional nuclease family protein [Bacteroidota bacterium]